MNKKEKQKLNTGDLCPECKKGRIVLMHGLITRANFDEEPYKEGVRKGEEEDERLIDEI